MDMMESKPLFDELVKRRIFPLHTMQSMADRWGITKQNVNNRRRDDKQFPKPVVGLVVETKRAATLFPLFEIERYEKVRGLKPREGAE